MKKYYLIIILSPLFFACNKTENKRDTVIAEALQMNNKLLSDRINNRLNYIVDKVAEKGKKREEVEIEKVAGKTKLIYDELARLALNSPIDTIPFFAFLDTINQYQAFIKSVLGEEPYEENLQERGEYRALFNQNDSLMKHALINLVSLKVCDLMNEFSYTVGGTCSWNFHPDIDVNFKIKDIKSNGFQYGIVISAPNDYLSFESLSYSNFSCTVPMNNLKTRKVNNALYVEFDNETGEDCAFSFDLDYLVDPKVVVSEYFTTHYHQKIRVKKPTNQ